MGSYTPLVDSDTLVDGNEKTKAIKCLRQLRNLLTDDLKLKSPIHDEKFLLRFVRAKKYDAALAHQCVRKYFRFRRKFPDLFQNAYPNYEPVKEFLEANAIVKLKHNDPEGRNIIVLNARYWNLEKFTFDHLCTAVALVLEELPETAQMKGVILISDKEGFTTAHSRTYSVSKIKAVAQMLQGAIPIRNKGVYIVRENKLMGIILGLMRPFLSEKTNSRIHMYAAEFDEVIKTIGADRLPKTLGGNLSEEDAYDLKFRTRLFERDSYYRGLSEYGFGEGCSDDEDTYM